MATPAEIQQPPPLTPITEPEPPSGPAAALILAGGIAVFCMGLVTTLGEASTGIGDALEWNDRVGSLSGKTVITVIVFALAWALLTARPSNSGPLLKAASPRLSVASRARPSLQKWQREPMKRVRRRPSQLGAKP
jgi:hypothetical protein